MVGRRKTLDEYLGPVGLALLAVIGSFFTGGIIQPIAYIFGISAIYYLIKKRKDPAISKTSKMIGWILVVLWLLEVGIASQVTSSSVAP